jgi:hypothetical protein
VGWVAGGWRGDKKITRTGSAVTIYNCICMKPKLEVLRNCVKIVFRKRSILLFLNLSLALYVIVLSFLIVKLQRKPKAFLIMRIIK